MVCRTFIVFRPTVGRPVRQVVTPTIKWHRPDGLDRPDRADPPDRPNPMQRNANLPVHTLTIAHRGAHSEPHNENTLEAHQLAANDPTLDGSECDVRFDKGRRTLVVAHDENLWESRGHNVKVSDYSAEDLVKDFNTPTLASVVQLFANRPLKTLVIDYKTPTTQNTIDAINQAEDLARALQAACSIMHLVWHPDLVLSNQDFRYPVYFVPAQVANVPAHLGKLVNHNYKGVSLSYGQLVQLGDRVRLLGAIARAELGVNLYGKLVHVDEMQRALANHCPGVATSVTVDWRNLNF